MAIFNGMRTYVGHRTPLMNYVTSCGKSLLQPTPRTCHSSSGDDQENRGALSHHHQLSRMHQQHCSTDLSTFDLWDEYYRAKEICSSLDLPVVVNPKAVFANCELALGEVDVFGFDYDYTLAMYTGELLRLIYALARDDLITKRHYPGEIKSLKYDPSFAVRGLHYDVQAGLLMKIDAFHKIQLGSVYRGLQPVPDEEVKKIYGGNHVTLDRMSDFHGKGDIMRQMVDAYSLAQVSLLANITQFFYDNGIPFDPMYVYNDINDSIRYVHTYGYMQKVIMENIEKYVYKKKDIVALLNKLTAKGKQLFLITNSPFGYVDHGLRYLVGDDWFDLFDVVVTNARKPRFFHDRKAARPFRMCTRTSAEESFSPQCWGKVTSLEKGAVYVEGNIQDMIAMTGWSGGRVLYFGDHVYSDLADPSLRQGWRTGAILPDIETDIALQSSSEYQHAMMWMLTLQQLVEDHQDQHDTGSQEVFHRWHAELGRLKKFLKVLVNPHFGSALHSYACSTYFYRRLHRYSDVYTSCVSNLARYPLEHVFYPQRTVLSHERPLHTPWFAHQIMSKLRASESGSVRRDRA